MVEREAGQNPENKLIAICGPTATGKTMRAVSLCRHLGGEVLSADSRQVYRGMDLGTGKDLEEYGNVAYHLIDICEPGEKYNLHRYIKDFRNALKTIRLKGKLPIVCGGSGMYLENALSGIELPQVDENQELRKSLEGKSLDELTEILKGYKTLHNTTDIDSRKRAIRAIEIEDFYRKHPEEAKLAERKYSKPIDSIIIGIDIPRQLRRERISKRLRERLDNGMVDEARHLLLNGLSIEDMIYYGLEYKFMGLYLSQRLTYEEMVSQLEIAIHQFAKRQMTWFRGMERRGFNIHWLPFDMPEETFIEEVCRIMNEEK